MKLKIKETAWGINRVAGGEREKENTKVSGPRADGGISGFGESKRHFTGEEVTEKRNTLSGQWADPE